MNNQEKEIRSTVLKFLQNRLDTLGFKEKFLLNDFDLLKTGLLDSMSFIQLIADLENHYGIEIDFENKLPSVFTTLSGLIKIVSESKKAE